MCKHELLSAAEFRSRAKIPMEGEAWARAGYLVVPHVWLSGNRVMREPDLFRRLLLFPSNYSMV
jgi:hypothetical protein